MHVKLPPASPRVSLNEKPEMFRNDPSAFPLPHVIVRSEFLGIKLTVGFVQLTASGTRTVMENGPASFPPEPLTT